MANESSSTLRHTSEAFLPRRQAPTMADDDSKHHRPDGEDVNNRVRSRPTTCDISANRIPHVEASLFKRVHAVVASILCCRRRVPVCLSGCRMDCCRCRSRPAVASDVGGGEEAAVLIPKFRMHVFRMFFLDRRDEVVDSDFWLASPRHGGCGFGR